MARLKKKIDGKEYSFGYWQVDDAMERLTLFTDIFGNSLARFMIGGAKATMDAKKKGENVLDSDIEELEFMEHAIEKLIRNFKEDNVKKLVKTFQTNLTCNNVSLEDNYNDHYKGQIGHMFKVIVAQARYQFHDFLGFLKGLKAEVPMEQTPSSPDLT